MAVFVVLTVVLSAAAQAAPSRYSGERNVQVNDGAVQLAQQWKRAFTESFEDGIGPWAVENYEGKLVIGSDRDGETGSCLSVRNLAAKGDTAFEVASPPVAVVGGARFRLRFSWRANRSLEQLGGHKGHYLTQVEWRDAANQPVAPQSFGFGEPAKEWQRAQVEGVIPEAAVSVLLRFGWDHPDLAVNEFFALDNVALDVQPERAPFESAGEIVSRPMRVAGEARRVAWEAVTPAGTTVRLQVASAADEAGGPGDWSEFLGPDGTARSFFTHDGELPAAQAVRPWLRYRALLNTDNSALTPVLKSVRLAEATDGPWAGLDTTPPAVVKRSPTRTADASAPIWFRLADESGVDSRSLRVKLDGLDVTGQLSRDDGRAVYRPAAPLAPPPLEAAVSRWRVNNYQNALTLERTARRTPDSPPGLHLTREAGEVDTAFCIQSPPIPIEPGAGYALAYWSRHTLNLKGAMNGKPGFSGGVTWLGAQDAPVGDRAPLDLGDANPEWHQDTYQLTAPAQAMHAQLAFGFDSPNLHDGAFLDLAEVTFDGPRPNRPNDAPNLHEVRVEVSDLAGNALTRTWHVLIRPPRTENVVTTRDDGTVLVDERPFFPLGLYAVWKKPFNNDSLDKAFGDLKAAGFNFAHTYSSQRGPDFAEFYAAAAKHGLKLFVASDAGANCTDTDAVLWDVVREEGQPALLAWYLADDTASHVGFGELQTLTDSIHDVDPAHLTVQADGVGGPPRSRYTNYVDSTDGFLPELYPIRDDGNRGVPQIITDMETVRADLAKSGARGKTIWAIVQYFQGWGWPRYPTRAELWAMSYLSLIHGANGITWYTYGGWGDNHGVTDTPETWQTICNLAGELSQLQDLLTERTGPQPPAPEIVAGAKEDALGHPSISMLLKDHAGKRYLIAANSADARVTARFTVGPVTQVSLPFEKRELTGANGGFADTFGPYAVHVYVWAP